MPSTFETILLGVFVLSLLLWFRPGLRAAMEHSRQAEKHWGDLVLPIGAVVAFVILLILIT
jgi:hypothetical protein